MLTIRPINYIFLHYYYKYTYKVIIKGKYLSRNISINIV